MKTEELDYRDFNRVEVTTTFDFRIVQSSSFGVSVEAEEGMFKNIKINVDGDTLKVTHSRHLGWRFRFSRPSVRISMPVIKGLRLTGAVEGSVKGFQSSEDFKLDMDGASKVTTHISAGNTEFHIRGACFVKVKGTAESTVIDVNGANHLDMEDFAVNNAAIRLNGASNCTIQVNGRLDVRLAGVSNLNLMGAPTIGDIRTSGLAKINNIS